MTPASPQPPRRSTSLWLWLGYWVLLFVLTHVPVPPHALHVPAGGDKALHFGLFFGLTLLGDRWLRASRRLPSVAALAAWAVAYAAYAGLDEWLQRFVGRTPSVWDWWADLSGIAVGTLLSALRRPGPAHQQHEDSAR